MNKHTEEYLKLIRKDELDIENGREQALKEEAEANLRAIHESLIAAELPVKISRYRLDKCKAVLTETVAGVYMRAIPLENPDKYADTLLPAARKEIVSSMSHINSYDELCEAVSKMSPYLKGLIPLFEDVCDKDDVPENAKEYEGKMLLSKDELALIKKFENDNSADVYAGAIQDRVLDVYKAEEDANKEQKEKIQAVVDAMNGAGETVTESVTSGIRIFDSEPKTIFNAIFVNKSKAIMQEAAGASIEDYADDILAETVCTYTLLECIHSLGVKTYSDNDRIRLRYDFITAGVN